MRYFHNKMQDQIITEQIDVAVVGDRSYELIQLMLNREVNSGDQKRKRPHLGYLDLISKLLPQKTLPKENSRPVISSLKTQKIVRGNHLTDKYTKVILTDSFWINIHFFIFDNRLFDPFTFDATKGNISICILASGQSTDLSQSKAYLHQTHSMAYMQGNNQVNLKDRSKVIKPQNVIEGKIFSLMHEMAVSGFPSVMALKITEEQRIIEDSSNLRLTVNQISRWIVDRHFENKHRIKIREQLGDEIENYQDKAQSSSCRIM